VASPDRPFVPHRTPKKARPVVGSSEFRLARPLVAGAGTVEAVQAVPAGAAQQGEPSGSASHAELASPARMESAPPLQPIEDFLHRPVQSAPPVPEQSVVDDFPSEFDEESGELPPVEHFLDPLPQVEDFVGESPNPFDEVPAASPEDFAGEPTSGSLAAEWADTDWQQYDWRSLAALGEGGESAASNDWATTDWDQAAPRAERAAKDARPTAAQAIASALDQIAQRIRSGELSAGGATDPATLAATLAAILGNRT
jgi:hypothetical protein